VINVSGYVNETTFPDIPFGPRVDPCDTTGLETCHPFGAHPPKPCELASKFVAVTVLIVPVPILFTPLLKATLPVGASPPVLTKPVKITLWPGYDGLRELESVVAVGLASTTML
jgi:hypothetical protein